jgi:hypothetical protein
MFEAGPGLEELLMRGLNLSQLPLQLFQSLVDVLNLLDNPEVSVVSTQLNVGSVGSALEPGLSNLERQGSLEFKQYLLSYAATVDITLRDGALSSIAFRMTSMCFSMS